MGNAMKSRTVRLAIAVTLAAGLGLLVMTLSAPRAHLTSPLSGAMAFDFGDVAYDALEVDVEHRFRLENVTDRTLTVRKTGASCRCTATSVSTGTIVPGGTTEIAVTMKFVEPGRQSERVWLDLGEDGVVTLLVSGNARRGQSFYAAQTAVPLAHEAPQEVLVVSTSLFSDDRPSVPELTAPPGVMAEFGGWELVFPHDEPTGRPARWQAIVRVSRTTDALESDGALQIAMGADHQVSVDLNGRPWD